MIFEVHRDEDVTGASGIGMIAWGVEFPDGRVAIRFATETASTIVFDSFEDMMRIHGHDGKTQFVRVDRWVKGGIWTAPTATS